MTRSDVDTTRIRPRRPAMVLWVAAALAAVCLSPGATSASAAPATQNTSSVEIIYCKLTADVLPRTALTEKPAGNAVDLIGTIHPECDGFPAGTGTHVAKGVVTADYHGIALSCGNWLDGTGKGQIEWLIRNDASGKSSREVSDFVINTENGKVEMRIYKSELAKLNGAVLEFKVHQFVSYPTSCTSGSSQVDWLEITNGQVKITIGDKSSGPTGSGRQ